MATPSTTALNRYGYLADPDDARELAFDYDEDFDAQYEDYVTECYEAGITPKPR